MRLDDTVGRQADACKENWQRRRKWTNAEEKKLLIYCQRACCWLHCGLLMQVSRQAILTGVVLHEDPNILGAWVPVHSHRAAVKTLCPGRRPLPFRCSASSRGVFFETETTVGAFWRKREYRTRNWSGDEISEHDIALFWYPSCV